MRLQEQIMLNAYLKSKISISGIATLRRHSLPTQPKRERERKRAYLIK
jgi:hypothetical protein